LKLRKKEEMLAKNAEYIRAELLKRKADYIQRIEVDEMWNAFDDDLLRKRNLILRCHQLQLDDFLIWVNTRRHEMLKNRDLEMEGPMKRYHFLTREIDNISKNGLVPKTLNGQKPKRIPKKDAIKAANEAINKVQEVESIRKKPRENVPLLYKTSPTKTKLPQKSHT
jgi:hypothetical protein